MTPRAPIHKHRNLLGLVAPRRRYGPRSAAPARARDRDRSLRPARPGRAAATVLVVGLVLLGAAAAEAQTERILVSNTVVGNDDTANTSGNDHAQLFHTGGHTDGYLLTGVLVNSEDTEGDDFDVDICTADTTANEFPTTACTALDAPSSFTAGFVHFTESILLSANTNYVVVIKQRGTGSVRLKSTTNTGEDSIGLSDWSIKNKFYWKSGSTWMIKSGSNEALRIVVRGYERSGPVTIPTVTSVEFTSTPPNPAYAIDGVVETTVNFSEAVDITGTPQLELDFAGTPKAIDCVAATNTNWMGCYYEVVAGDSAPNGIAIAANKLTLNGGTITATGSTTITAVLAHAAVAIDANHKVDGVRPTLVTSGDDAPQTSADGTEVILTFSEDIGVVDVTRFSMEVNSGIGQLPGTTATISGRTVTVPLFAVYTIQFGQTVTLSLGAAAVKDIAGNINSSIQRQAVTNNVLQPPAVITGVAITSDPGTDQIYATNDVIEVTATFDLAVAVTGTPQIELRLGDIASTDRLAEYASGSGTTALVFSYPVVATDESDTDGIALGNIGLVTDTVELNGGTITVVATGENASLSYAPLSSDSGHRVNWARPTLSSAVTSTDGTKVILTFSENLAPGGRNITLFTVKVGGTAVTLSGTVATISGNSVTLTLATALTSATQAVTVSYADPTPGDDGSGIEDLAGNDADSFTDQTVTNRFGSTTAPTVTGVEITSLSVNDFSGGISALIEATVTFSAAVDITGTPQLELDFDGTPKAAACDADTNTTAMVCFYTVAVGDSAPDGIAIAANKLTLNGGTITATGSTTITAVLAHAAVAIDAGQKVDGIRPTLVTTGTDAPTTSTDGTKVILTFSEDIEFVNRSLISILANAATQSTTADSRAGTKVELTLATALTATATNLTVALAPNSVFDAAGNSISLVLATGVINAVGSTTAPTVTAVELISTPNDNVYAIDDTVVVAVRFSEVVDITGTPQLELDFAGTPKPADCLPDTNTTGMACNYTVVVNDSAPNGIAIAANKLTLNGGTIRAAGSTTLNADLTHSDAWRSTPGTRSTAPPTRRGR